MGTLALFPRLTTNWASEDVSGPMIAATCSCFSKSKTAVITLIEGLSARYDPENVLLDL